MYGLCVRVCEKGGATCLLWLPTYSVAHMYKTPLKVIVTTTDVYTCKIDASITLSGC